MKPSIQTISNLLGIVRTNRHKKLNARLKWLRDAAFSTSAVCIEWPGARNAARGGYGIWHPHPPHRAALMIRIGRTLNDGEQAQHHCDNPACCNGSHLYAGDKSQNLRDAWARNPAIRCKLHFGVKHHSARLDPEKVRAIRQARAQGEKVLTLAQRYGVTDTAISKIANRQSWKNVE